MCIHGGVSKPFSIDHSFSDANILISETDPFLLSSSQLDFFLELPVTSSQLYVPGSASNMNLPTEQIKLKKKNKKKTGYPAED